PAGIKAIPCGACGAIHARISIDTAAVLMSSVFKPPGFPSQGFIDQRTLTASPVLQHTPSRNNLEQLLNVLDKNGEVIPSLLDHGGWWFCIFFSRPRLFPSSARRTAAPSPALLLIRQMPSFPAPT